MIRFVAVSCACLVLAVAAWAEERPRLQWHKDVEKALVAAREEGQPVLIYVHDSV